LGRWNYYSPPESETVFGVIKKRSVWSKAIRKPIKESVVGRKLETGYSDSGWWQHASTLFPSGSMIYYSRRQNLGFGLEFQDEPLHKSSHDSAAEAQPAHCIYPPLLPLLRGKPVQPPGLPSQLILILPIDKA
jgi:hypothetical protein